MSDIFEVLEEKLIERFYADYPDLDIRSENAVEQREEVFHELFAELDTQDIGELILSDPIMKEEYLVLKQNVDVFYRTVETRRQHDISDEYKAIILQKVAEAASPLQKAQLEASYIFQNNYLIKKFEQRLLEILETEPVCEIEQLVSHYVNYLQETDFELESWNYTPPQQSPSPSMQ